MYRSYALLPTGTTMNPLKPETSFYFEPNQSYQIAKSETGTYRIFSSYGLFDEDDLYKIMPVHHDQTGRYLGDFTIVGIVSTNQFTGERFSEGEIPNKKIPFWVYK